MASLAAQLEYQRVSSGIDVAFFALFATMSVAKYGFSKRTTDR